MNRRRHHWTENPVGPEKPWYWLLVGETEDGVYLMPHPFRRCWSGRLDLRKPWHWAPWSISLLTGSCAWTEPA